MVLQLKKTAFFCLISCSIFSFSQIQAETIDSQFEQKTNQTKNSQAKKNSQFYYGRSIDHRLRARLSYYNVGPVQAPPAQDPALVKLGRNLFFEKEIAGTRNISCATCHNPVLGSADAQSQSRGQGATGLGAARRQDGEFFKFLARNTLSLWNRGVKGWDVMFWDGRLGGNPEDGFFSPAGDDTPQNFTSALAAFSIIPVTPDEEMRGFPGQLDALGNPNEMSDLTNDDFAEIWPLVTARVTNHPAYDDMLAAAFPGVPESELNITHITEALGAFMIDEFTALNSPFDQYLAGDNHAMSKRAKRGALLFYGRANCASCHSGGLQTDFDFHNIAAPQVGSGRGDAAPLDLGRGAINGNPDDNFKFRTPSLRNIELEAPYFHNGAFARLEDAVRHHLDPATSLANYDDSQVEPEFRGTYQDDPETIDALLSTVSPYLRVYGRPLREREIQDLMAFLSALTDPSSINKLDSIPDELPSGLPLAH
ncbi:cytochrome-c peroxidase [Aliikangiella coralliicola]|uniref:C-type cytochrome n=1 Tax=Aliikangiella coralliicola TaxID=2592383 RepID=A0A545UE50_9GAMM|nr:cytochrome c peroxidase [Aliikangiella coralliicola]TQV87750.1 c-type cytochrome [Aliikangiella coralliicola]